MLERPADPNLSELAQRARWALTDGRDATLLIAGAGRILPGAGDPTGVEVTLYDHSGSPTFVCPGDSAIAAAIDRSALLSLSAHGGQPSLTVILTGRLRLLAEDQPAPGKLIIGLSLDQVVVETDCPNTGTVVQEAVPLGLYWLAKSARLTRYADTIVAHTNDHHQSEVRTFAADRVGQHPDEIASATLSDLTRYGAALTWIDLDGAHHDRIHFPVPAASAEMLSNLLREQLDPDRTDHHRH